MSASAGLETSHLHCRSISFTSLRKWMESIKGSTDPCRIFLETTISSKIFPFWDEPFRTGVQFDFSPSCLPRLLPWVSDTWTDHTWCPVFSTDPETLAQVLSQAPPCPGSVSRSSSNGETAWHYISIIIKDIIAGLGQNLFAPPKLSRTERKVDSYWVIFLDPLCTESMYFWGHFYEMG